MTLTRPQAATVERVIVRQLAYLTKLCHRLDAIGYEPTEPLYTKSHAAQEAVHALRVQLQYLGREGTAQ